MAENFTEVLVGGVVIAVAGGFLAYASQFGGARGAGQGYELTASFRSAEGVAVGSDIRLAGVKVGTVGALDLNPQTFRADARLVIDTGIDLPDDSAVVISSEGLLGGNFVELLPGGSPFNFEPGAAIEDTQGAVSLISLLVKFAAGTGGGEE